jgi:hypothetical protein
VKVEDSTYMPFLFEKLDVYQRAVNLAETITALSKSFPPQGHYHLVDQLRRASLSISLNSALGVRELALNGLMVPALFVQQR